jgi:formate hydrogenlyase subunit 3/multisubunit Na+/H+ antiporter MnhD subunit
MKQRSGREWATVALLPLVWVVGVVLLWRSRAWTPRDKLIGTLVVPGGLAYVIYVAVDAVLLLTGGCEPPEEGCSVAIYIDPVSALMLAALTVLPLASAIYLAIRADLSRST